MNTDPPYTLFWEDRLRKALEELKRADSGSIPAGLHIQGQISGTEDLVVHGTVEGPIQLAGCALTVGAEGKVFGDIVAHKVSFMAP